MYVFISSRHGHGCSDRVSVVVCVFGVSYATNIVERRGRGRVTILANASTGGQELRTFQAPAIFWRTFSDSSAGRSIRGAS